MTHEAAASACCRAPMTVEGDTTRYYVCTKCSRACDPMAAGLPVKTASNEVPPAAHGTVGTSTPEVAWDAMTEQQKVEWLATEVMAWRKATWKTRDRYPDFIAEKHGLIRHWAPLTDWNHWRQVEEQILENHVLRTRFGDRFPVDLSVDEYMEMTLPERARELYLAFQSLR